LNVPGRKTSAAGNRPPLLGQSDRYRIDQKPEYQHSFENSPTRAVHSLQSDGEYIALGMNTRNDSDVVFKKAEFDSMPAQAPKIDIEMQKR